MKQILHTLAILLFTTSTLLISGCSDNDDDVVPTNNEETTITILNEESDFNNLVVGHTIQINASSSDSDNTFYYTSGNNEIATVDELGIIEGISEGTTEINIENNSTSTTITVNVGILTYTVDSENTDEQGVKYIIDTENNTAATSGEENGMLNNNVDFSLMNNTVVIPVYIEKDGQLYPVVSINKNSFYQNRTIKNIEFAKGSKIERIEHGGFGLCANLEGQLDFTNCKELKSIEMGAFIDCDLITSIDISACESLTSISSLAFYKNELLSEVNITGCTALNEIGANAFGECSTKLVIDLTSSGKNWLDSKDNPTTTIESSNWTEKFSSL